MSEMQSVTRREALFAEAERILRELATLEHATYSDAETIAAVRADERLHRMMEPIDHVLILDVERRGVPAHGLFRGTGGWLRETLRVDIYEADARVRAAHAAGTRRSLLGQPQPTAHPIVAAAQASGQLAAKQARVITSMLDKLPVSVCEQVPQVEQALVDSATEYDANALATLAQRHRDWLDPDGTLPDVEKRRRDRDLRSPSARTVCAADRSRAPPSWPSSCRSRSTPWAPRPGTNGVQDPRTAGQRRHDALLDTAKIAVGSGNLPTAGGVLATVILTVSEESYRTGSGFATTGHGAPVPTREAMRWAGGDHRLFLTVLNSLKAVIAYSGTHRLFTEGQRLAMIAHGPTCLDNGCLLCGFHHREFERAGWTVHLVDGRPQWTPPRWIDPEQKPIRT